MREVQIYALQHPETLEIRYVGKTVKRLSSRLSNHLYNAKKTRHNKHLSNWICSLLVKKVKPIIICLELCNEDNWKEREKYWIRQYSTLINLTEGGDGSEGYVHNAEAITKIKKARIGFKHTQDFKEEKSRFFKEIERTEEWKNNISKSKKGLKASEQAKINLSNAHKGYKMPEEQKEKIRQALLGRKRPQAVKDKIKATHIARIKI